MTRKLRFLVHLTVKEPELFEQYSHAHSFRMIINVSQGENFSAVILRYFYWFPYFHQTLD